MSQSQHKSYLKYFIKHSIVNTIKMTFHQNFLIVAMIGFLFQFNNSSSKNESIMDVSFWINCALSILGIGTSLIILKNYRFVYCVLKTLPRDIRGAWRFSRTLNRIRWAEKNNYTVAKIFDLYADKNPNKICFYYEDEKWTFKQVQDMSNRVGNYFATLGFKKGETVALFMESRPEYVCIWMGLNKIGVCAALVNYNLRFQPLLHSISIVNAVAVIFGHELTSAMQELMEIDTVLSTIPIFSSGHKDHPILKGVGDLDAEILSVPLSTPPELDGMRLHDSLYYTYTSGTTGMPKAAIIKQYRYMMAAGGVHFMNQVREDDIVYDSLPLYHMTGGMVGIGQALLHGTSVVIRKRFSASQFWQDCIKYNVTVAQYLGETCRYLLAQPITPEEKMHSVRLFSGNGLRHEIWEEVVSRFNIPEVGEVYGSTEGNCNTSNINSKVGSVGFVPRLLYPLLPMTLARVDEYTGEPIRDPDTGLVIRCKPNEPGELVGKIIKGHPIRDFQGYTDKVSTDKKILRSVFKAGDYSFRTGDILVMDEFGYIYFKDRTGDTFRWKGENVSTTEVEAIISSHSSYKDAVVYGVKIPNTEGRAGMVAIADPDGTLDLPNLADGISKSLPSYARPLFLRVLDIMDMTGTYKMKKIRFQDDGYDINKIKDKMYFFTEGKFVPLKQDVYLKINSGLIKL